MADFSRDNCRCSVCFKECTLSFNNAGGNKDEGLQRRFFTFACRYLNFKSDNFDPDNTFLLAGKVNGVSTANTDHSKYVCDCCTLLVGSFCEIYDRLQILQMELNRKLEQIVEVMKESRGYIQNTRERAGAHSNTEGVGFRRQFLMRIGEHQSKTFPRVLLNRMPNPEEYLCFSEDTPVVKVEEENEMISSLPVPYEEAAVNPEDAEMKHECGSDDSRPPWELENFGAPSPVSESTEPNCSIPIERSQDSVKLPYLSRRRRRGSQKIKRQFKCSYCEKCFSTSWEKDRHESVHTGSKPFICTYCGWGFSNKSHAIDHERRHTGERPYKCPYPFCYMRFRQKATLFNHKRKIHKMQTRSKSSVNKKKSRIIIDMRSLLEEPSNQMLDSLQSSERHAVIPGEKCRDVESLVADQEQTQNSSSKIRHYCPMCNKGFQTPSAVARHVRSHTGLRPFKCSYCFKRFKDKSHVTDHERIHTGLKPFNCGQCDQSFRQYSALYNHNKVHTCTNKKVHKTKRSAVKSVQPAPASVSQPVKLEPVINEADDDHRPSADINITQEGLVQEGTVPAPHSAKTPQGNSLEPEEPDDLPQPPKKSSKQSVRKKGLDPSERPYKCNFCERQFKMKSHASDHERSHTGERPYFCDVCGKNFIQYSSLFNHLKIHKREQKSTEQNADPCTSSSGARRQKREKRFECRSCEKRFTTSSSRRLHERDHEGIKSFKCNVCSKEFLRKNYLRDHARIHSGEKPFQCDICGKRFNQYSILFNHKRTHMKKRSSDEPVMNTGFINHGTQADPMPSDKFRSQHVL